MKPELVMWAVTRLETFKRDLRVRRTFRLATATGFFYETSDGRLLLVTNKHVLYKAPSHESGRQGGEYYVPDSLRLYVHSVPGSTPDLIGKRKAITVRLWSKEGQKLWKEHRDRTVDVAALQVSWKRLEEVNAKIAAFSGDDVGNDLFSSSPDVQLGAQVLAVGFPLGFHDRKTGLPMARAAVVASVPWLGFEGKPCFLIDGRLHPGMSGSPVISLEGRIRIEGVEHSSREQRQRERGSYLLGVVSSEWTTSSEPLGLNNVWHAAVIKEIVDDH